MGSWRFFIFIFLCYYTLLAKSQYGQKVNPIEEYSDQKAFKQLLRTRTNVMVLFMKHLTESSPIYKAYKEAALEVRGIGTMVAIDCGGAGKKLCKTLKANPEPHVLHHFKDGKFNKVYERKETAKSLVRFMNDPTGDIPWEEEPTGKSVVHLGSPASLDKLVRKKKPVLVMFYAPWCVYCKQMKPEFAAAAARVKTNGDGVLAAMDVLRPENIPIRMKYNITGFPTLIYFSDGKPVKTYDGDNKEDKFVEFMKDPTSVVTPAKEVDWADTETDVVHLNQENFDATLQEEKSVLVMFYAPWCGHCKKMKPEYEKAATFMKNENIPGILAAVDSTRETALSEKFGVRGFPTIKYFRDGEFAFNTPQLRDVSKLMEFMRSPKEPPPEPPPEPAWSEMKSEVVHLTDENFKSQLRSKRHALVMFYAPWCGHCKQAKPEFTSAAEQLKDLSRTVLAAVDCDEHRALCKVNDVKGYPTFKYFRYYNKEPPLDYNGGRSAADFVKYMSKFEEVEQPAGTPEPVVGKKDTAEKQEIKPIVEKDTKPVVEKQDQKSTGERKDGKPVIQKNRLTKEQPSAEKPDSKHKVKQETKPQVERKDSESVKDKVLGTEDIKVKSDEDFNWAKIEGGNKILQLDNDNFEATLKKHSSVVVLFHAPWCEHCKKLKPAYAKAAQTVEPELGVFGACDVDMSEDIADKYLIRALPVIKYFKNGEEKSTFSGDRTTENFVAFLKTGGNVGKDEL